MKKRTTIADVARAAGVSMMTVSRAVNQKPGLNQELRQKILALAEEMDYRPSQIARGLATSRTTTVGLVVPDITNPFFAEIARGVEDVAFESGYTVFLINTAEDREREQAALNSLWEHEIDGAILCSLRLPQKQLSTAVKRFPAAVLFNRELSLPGSNIVSMSVNDKQGAYEAVGYFVRQGRAYIAFLAGPKNSISSQRRLEGYRQGLMDAGIEYNPSLTEYCLPDTENGYFAAQVLLSRRPDIDALFAFNDLVAVGALRACWDAGQSVPKDIAIIGSDDIPLASIIRPQLTTLHVNLKQIGRTAMRTLLEIIAGNTSHTTLQIEPELCLRETT